MTKKIKIPKKVYDEIEAAIIYTKPFSTTENENGTVTHSYRESIIVDDKKYTYWIDWSGCDDGEDGGNWSEPYNILED